jgi:tetratricopeptide (TPR) repeat protein
VGWDAFISHAWLDQTPDRAARPQRALVPKLVEQLSAAGWDVFYDADVVDDFDEIPETVRRALADSVLFISWFSDVYPTRRACAWELTTALLADPGGERILAVNPERDGVHLEGSPLRRRRVATCPDADDEMGWQVLGANISARISSLAGTRLGGSRDEPPPWFPDRQPAIHSFTGRFPELWALDGALRGSDLTGDHAARGTAVVDGLGGVGKTVLTLEYAHRYGPAWSGGIVWLSGRGYDRDPASRAPPERRRAQRMDALKTLALSLRIDLGPLASIEALADQEIRLRADIGAALDARDGPVLWVVDDLGPDLDAAEIRAWLAPGQARRATSLITTRSTEYQTLLRPLSVGELSPGDGYALLTSDHPPVTPAQRKAAERLVDVLGGHPQAIDITRADIGGPDGYERHVDRLADAAHTVIGLEELAELVRGELPGGHGRSVAATVAASLQDLDEDAALLMAFAPCFDSMPLPLSLFTTFLTPERASNAVQAADATARVRRGFHRLVSASLARPIGDDALQIHRLVALVALAMGEMQPDEIVEYRNGVRNVAREIVADLLEPLSCDRAFARYRLLNDLGRSLVDDGHFSDRLTISLLSYQVLSGDPFGAIAAGFPLLTDAEGRLGTDDTMTIGYRGMLAFALQTARRATEAVALLEANLSALERLDGQEYEDMTLTTRVNLADTYRDAGQHDRAIALGEQVVTDLERGSGADAYETLAARGALALSYAAVQRTSDAIELETETLSRREGTLGPDHLTVLTSCHNLAGFLRATGNVEGAIRYGERALDGRTRQLGPDHLQTLGSASELARTFWDAGRREDAVNLMRETAARSEIARGATAPWTEGYHRTLDRWLSDLAMAGDPIADSLDALDALRRVAYATYVRALDGGDPADLDAACAQQLRVRELADHLLPSDDRVRLADHLNLARALDAQGQTTDAIDIAVAILPLLSASIGDEEPLTVTAATSLISMALRADRRDLARQVFDEHLMWTIDADPNDLVPALADMRAGYLKEREVRRLEPIVERWIDLWDFNNLAPSQRYLEQHEDDLLRDAALQIVNAWAKQAPHLALLGYARAVLGASRERGVAASYLSITIIVTLDSWLGLDDPDEAVQYLHEHASLLLTDEAEAKMRGLADHDEHLEPRLRTLRQARAARDSSSP